MTVTPFVSTAEPAIAARVVPEYDEQTARLLMLLTELDKAGLPGELGQARALLGRAGEVAREYGEGRAVVSSLRDELIAAVVAGSRGVADAAVQLAAVDVEAAGAHIVQGAVRALRQQAVAAVKADGMAVHGVLAGRVAAAVSTAVNAGAVLIDVKAVARALTPPAARDRGPQRAPAPVVHPWVNEPPTLPVVSLESIAGDRVKVTAWAEASAAGQDIGRLFDTVRALHAVIGGSSTLYAADPDRDQAYFVARLPEPVQLAVGHALGWNPALHLSMRPAAPQPPRSLAETIVAGIRYPAGWLGIGKKAPMDGPYGNGGRPRS